MQCNQASRGLCLLVLIKYRTHVEAPPKNFLHALKNLKRNTYCTQSQRTRKHSCTQKLHSQVPLRLKLFLAQWKPCFPVFTISFCFQILALYTCFSPLVRTPLIRLYHLPGLCPYISSSLCFSYPGLSISRLENLPS